jgi:hypothetical protein
MLIYTGAMSIAVDLRRAISAVRAAERELDPRTRADDHSEATGLTMDRRKRSIASIGGFQRGFRH